MATDEQEELESEETSDDESQDDTVSGDPVESNTESDLDDDFPVVVTGDLVYTDDALASIAQHAIEMTEGIGIVSKQPTGILSRFTRQKASMPQLRLKSQTDKYVAFDIDVWVSYGISITEISEQLQRSVSDELERITGKKGVVNIRVRGLV